MTTKRVLKGSAGLLDGDGTRPSWSPEARFAFVAPLCCGLLLSACSRQQKAPPPPPPPEVATVTVERKPVLLTTELPGRTSPYLIAEIRPQVSGLLLKRLFTEGVDVRVGQVLYEIDPAPFKASLDNAAASLDAARKGAERASASLSASLAGVDKQRATAAFANTNRKRFEDLLKEKAVSANDCDQAKSDADVAAAALKAADAQVQSDRSAVAAAAAAIKQAEAALETAKINLAYTKITAPISGRIGRSSVTDGAIVTAYQAAPLATIQQLDPIYVDIPQSTADQLRLRHRLEKGHIRRENTEVDKVQLLLEDGTRYPSEGTLQFSDISVDSTTGSVILRMVFPNPDHCLLPNLFVRAVLKEGVNEQAILLPQQAVSRNSNGDPIVFVVNSSRKVEQRAVVIEQAVGNQWMVAEGVQLGELVIAEGLQRAKPGTEVKTVPFQK